MTGEGATKEQVRTAIDGLTIKELVRLRFIASALNSRRHEDLLQEAIKRTLAGEREWRAGVDLLGHIHQCMRSIEWAWSKKRDESFLLESQSGTDGEGASIQRVEDTLPDPERQAGSEMAVQRIMKQCKSDSVVLGVIEGKRLGQTGREIRESLNLSKKDFEAACQRLRRYAKKALGMGGMI
jgi:hypothetical protein